MEIGMSERQFPYLELGARAHHSRYDAKDYRPENLGEGALIA